MTENDLNLLQGTLDVLILKALASRPVHGYGVARWIRTVTDESLTVEDGALYTSLHRMEKKRWVKSFWDRTEQNRRAKFYELTKAGRKELEYRSRQWSDYVEAVSKVLRHAG